MISKQKKEQTNLIFKIVLPYRGQRSAPWREGAPARLTMTSLGGFVPLDAGEDVDVVSVLVSFESTAPVRRGRSDGDESPGWWTGFPSA